MGIRKRGNKWLVTAESGCDEFGVRRRVCRSVDTEEEAKRLDAKLRHDVYEGRSIKPSTELVPDFCQRFLDGRDKLAPATRSRYEGYLKRVDAGLPRPGAHLLRPHRADRAEANEDHRRATRETQPRPAGACQPRRRPRTQSSSSSWSICRYRSRSISPAA
jgi:hypothetical protein